jgi:small subunit ribosomal protein S16
MATLRYFVIHFPFSIFHLKNPIKEVIPMAVKMRLKRMGAKKSPFYRVVVADSRSPRDGRFIENLGHYDSTTEPAVIKIDEDKAIAWLQKGAIPTDTVRSLLKKTGVLKKWDELKKAKQGCAETP